MKRIFLFASLTMAAACAGDRSSTEAAFPSEITPVAVQPVAGFDDQQFVQMALSGGMFELESSRYVLQVTTFATADTLAQEMLDDHHTINADLTELAERKGWAVPETMLPKHEGMLDALRQSPAGLVGDRYIELQRKAHEDAILLYDRCSKLCLDPDLKLFAGTALLMLREHLEEVERRLPSR